MENLERGSFEVEIAGSNPAGVTTSGVGSAAGSSDAYEPRALKR
jgi:hypothetical protein